MPCSICKQSGHNKTTCAKKSVWKCPCCDEPNEKFRDCEICFKAICSDCARCCSHKEEWQLDTCDYHICADCEEANEGWTHPDCLPSNLCGDCGKNIIEDDDGADLCTICRKHADLPEDSEEDDDDDSSSVSSDSSVHTTCCVGCGKSFTFSTPVSRIDYNQNKHEQECPSCRKDTEVVQELKITLMNLVAVLQTKIAEHKIKPSDRLSAEWLELYNRIKALAS